MFLLYVDNYLRRVTEDNKSKTFVCVGITAYTFAKIFPYSYKLHLKKVATPIWKAENTAVEFRHADHVAPSIRNSWH
jgi:hypothetical protein